MRRIYREYLGQGYSVRFMYRGTILPNIEFKLARTRYQIYSVENCYEVVLNNSFRLRIAPIELQIAYKLRLGSEKDMGDAVFLYSLFKQVIDGEELLDDRRRNLEDIIRHAIWNAEMVIRMGGVRDQGQVA